MRVSTRVSVNVCARVSLSLCVCAYVICLWRGGKQVCLSVCVSVFVCVTLCVCISLYLCVCVSIFYVCVCVSVLVTLCVCLSWGYVGALVCMYVYVFVCLSQPARVSLEACVCICARGCFSVSVLPCALICLCDSVPFGYVRQCP